MWQEDLSKHPKISGIPWVYRDPVGSLAHWNKKIGDVFLYGSQQIQKIDKQSLTVELLPSTKQRLELLKTAYAKQHECLKAILPPELLKGATPNDLISLDRVPKQQSAMAYYATIFRDWVWGQSQVEQYAKYLIPGLVGKKSIGFLGAGACGLPIAIHNEIGPQKSVAFDINPLLFLPAAKLVKGETVRLVEMPAIPTESKNVFIEHEIKPVK